jgi:O-antigen ligase
MVTSGLIAALACLPLLLAYSPYVLARTDASGLIETEARSLNEREALTVAANEVFLAHPILGVGLGGLPIAIRDAEPDFPFTYQPAHVVLLDVAAETGALGALLYLALLVAPWLAMARHRHRWTPDLAVASAAVAATTVVGFFDYYTWSYPAGRIWAWLILALWAATYRRAVVRAAAAEREGRNPRALALASQAREPAGA